MPKYPIKPFATSQEFKSGVSDRWRRVTNLQAKPVKSICLNGKAGLDDNKMQIGRNDPCPCQSGLKCKKCCGNPLKKNIAASRPIPTEALVELKRREAAELIREQQQGLGNPIVAFRMNDRQIVAAGNTLYWSPTWKTNADFLGDYMKQILSGEWGNAEIAKPLNERHPIMQWYEEYFHFQRRHLIQGKIKSAPATGVVNCYLGLAYSLYLIKHNVELQNRLVKRLKSVTQFQGAYYELFVANCLIRAGFKLELEDETDLAVKHCEFSAVSKTGKKYWPGWNHSGPGDREAVSLQV